MATSEVHALLLTDLADSTRLSQRLGDAAMGNVWVVHDRLARDLLRQWSGREIDKSDGLLILFESAAQAVGYALAYHKALASLSTPLFARAGVHVGAVTLRENSAADISLGAKPLEVDGLAKPATARVMSLALPGQTLLTAEAKAALGATSIRVQSHGFWRMQGLLDPFELFEAGEEETRFVPPPDAAKAYRVTRLNDLWVPLHRLPHTLPAERDAFVGRAAFLDEMSRQFAADTRLVSIFGTGGIGKTRVALRFAWSWLGDFVGGVWFCDLSQARSLDGIANAVAKGLDIALTDDDPVQQLGNAIAGRGRCLVILDNFEQVAGLAETTLGCWLDRAIEARFIVTTRSLLGIAGEDAMDLPPLAPEESRDLFVRRATAAKREFRAAPNDPTLDQLVRLLDCLPLAIELAAARVKVMSPRTLLQRMGERFKLLTSTGKRSGRHGALRATFDWSWDHLTTAERAMLAQLATFEGGFSLEAAERVIDLSAQDSSATPTDVLESLVEKSLVRAAENVRFSLLISVQEYALEQLKTEGRFPGSGLSAYRSATRRHWSYFSKIGEAAAVADGCADVDNLVAATRRAAEYGDGPAAVASLVSAWATLKLRGPYRAAVDLAANVRTMNSLDASALPPVEWVAGSALYMLGEVGRAREHFESGLRMVSADPTFIGARLECALGELLTTQGAVDEAADRIERALAKAERLADPLLMCEVLNALGALENDRGRLDQARDHYQRAIALARKASDYKWEGGLLGNLGTVHYALGNLDLALSLHEQALVLAQRTGDRRWEGNARCNVGLLTHEHSRTVEAQAQLEAALDIARTIGHTRLECTVLCNLGLVLEAQDLLEPARVNYEKAVALAEQVGDKRSVGQFRSHLGVLYSRLGAFDLSRACFETGAMELRSASDLLTLALLYCRAAESELKAADPAAARIALAQARQLAEEVNANRDSELGKEMARVQQLVHRAGDMPS